MEIAHNAHVKVALALNMHSTLTETLTMRRGVGERNCGCVVYDTLIDSSATTFLGCRWCVSKRWKFPSPQGQKQTPHQKRKWFFLPYVRPSLKMDGFGFCVPRKQGLVHDPACTLPVRGVSWSEVATVPKRKSHRGLDLDLSLNSEVNIWKGWKENSGMK